jgi:hypothetical protein
MFRTFRSIFYKLVPPWLSSGEGELVLLVLHTIKDASLERMRQAHLARYPSFSDDAGLDLIGRDRRIIRGRSEAREHYVERLKRWRWPRGHRVRGSAYALLEQVSEYWGGILVQSFDVNQTKHERDPDGVESYARDTGWDWDGDVSAWARFWLVLWPNPEIPEIKAWPDLLTAGASPLPTNSLSIGQQGVTQDDLRSMRRLFRAPSWKPAGTKTQYWVVVLGDRNTPQPVDPAGEWGTIPGRIAAQQANPRLRFWKVR